MAKLEDLIRELNIALAKEYAHWHFYTNAAITVQGPHREEFQELFLEEAADEAKHVHEFGKLILGLGGRPFVGVNVVGFAQYFKLADILNHACNMEKEVVEDYIRIMDLADELEKNGGEDKTHGRYIHIFLEDKLMDSRQAVDHLTEMLKDAN